MIWCLCTQKVLLNESIHTHFKLNWLNIRALDLSFLTTKVNVDSDLSDSRCLQHKTKEIQIISANFNWNKTDAKEILGNARAPGAFYPFI